MRAVIAMVLSALTITAISLARPALHQQTISRDTPLYITPHIQGLDLLDKQAVNRLKSLLDSLEPEGAQGNVQLGFTLGFDIYSYYVRQPDNQWVFDRELLRSILSATKELNRPVVIYVAGNHFFGHSPYAQYLQKEKPQTLMRYYNGSIPKERYFRTQIAPFRLDTDKSLPHFTAKMEALRILAEEIHLLGDRLVAITLNGETHYLYEDFFSGTGKFVGAKMTDYAQFPISKEVNAYDSGIFPIYGWYCGEGTISVYNDGKEIAIAQRGLSRLDVYEQATHVTDANCGFRVNLDIADWSAGDYALQIMLTQHRSLKQMPNGRIVLRVSRTDDINMATTIPRYEDIDISAWLDIPQAAVSGWVDSSHTHVCYRREVRRWMEKRSAAIKHHVEAMADILLKQGIAKEMIYSYQLAPWLKADWNSELFGIGEDFFRSSSMRAGITLYGGLTRNDLIFSYLPPHEPYGIPEFHPQMHKDSHYPLAALRYHQQRGATFISPYFMNIALIDQSGREHGQMMIRADNPSRGSGYFYQAIKQLVRE